MVQAADLASQVAITAELVDFNEIHVEILYGIIMGQAQESTIYIRDLVIEGTVFAQKTALLITRTVESQFRPKTLLLEDNWLNRGVDMSLRAGQLLQTISKVESRVSLDWYVHDWADFISNDLSDKVRLELPTISSDAFIEGVRLRIPLSTINPVCTLDLSLVESTPTPPPPPPPPPAGDSVTVPLTGLQEFTNYIRWPDNVSLGSTFAADGTEQTLNFVDLNNNSPAGRVSLAIVGFNRRFTTEFEATGLITFEASDGETLEVMIADADMTETYAWTPTNSAEVVAFVAHVRGLSDQDVTLTLSD